MAKRITLKRVFQYAWLSFRRNAWLSAATVLVMTLTLFVIGGLLLTSVIAATILGDLEKKIDISVSFKRDASESAILQIQREVESLSSVREADYVSASEALDAFKEKHRDDPTILASLEELGDENPLPATLNIKARDPNDLREVADFFARKNYPGVEKVNYFENQKIIERLTGVIRGVRSIGIAIVAVLGFVAVLIAFTTIRLAIYTAKDEINIMKLVGATNWYIRGPFLINGVFYGFIASALVALSFFPLIWISSPRLALFLDINLQRYFSQNFFEFYLILLVIGIILGAGSSMVATRRYLKGV